MWWRALWCELFHRKHWTDWRRYGPYGHTEYGDKCARCGRVAVRRTEARGLPKV